MIQEAIAMRVSRAVLFLPALVFVSAASLGANLQKGITAYNSADYETAMAECLPLAEAGDAGAQFCVGRMYANGFGVDMNDEQALNWYGLAAEQGHGEAAFNLGVMHANGWGVPMDDKIAFEWYLRAAESGFAQAQATVAALYVHARGVEENLAEAYRWYVTAEKLGDASYTAELEALAAELTDEDIITAHHRADSWVEKFDGRTMQADNIH